jgi:hypothetical protein
MKDKIKNIQKMIDEIDDIIVAKKLITKEQSDILDKMSNDFSNLVFSIKMYRLNNKGKPGYE